MKYICAQPSTFYYAWQIDVMLHSFRQNEVSDVDVVCSKPTHEYFDKLNYKYPWVNFYFYEDTRMDKHYPPSTKAHLLKKHLNATGIKSFFLTDCDIALTKPLNLNSLKGQWCFSNTNSYLGYDYILSKGRRVLELMLRTANISEELVKSNKDVSGGAQYLFSGVDSNYFNHVELLSNKLYIALTKDREEHPNEEHPIQKWTAEMWAFLWVAWKRGIKTTQDKRLDFCFATSPIKQWEDVAIYHNAGVINDKTMFYKGKYQHELPPKNLKIDPSKANFKYYKLIKEAIYGIKQQPQ